MPSSSLPLLFLLVGLVSCSGSTKSSDSNGTDTEKLCFLMCKKLATGGCPEAKSGSYKDCGEPCIEQWHNCDAWPELVACLDQFESYSCAGEPACAAPMKSVLACAGPPPDAGLVDCVPGQPVPACVCDGGTGPVKVCGPSGKTEPCACP